MMASNVNPSPGNCVLAIKAIQYVCSEALTSVDRVVKGWHTYQKALGLQACSQPVVCATKKGKPKQPASCFNCANWGTALEGVYYTNKPLVVKQLTWKNVNSYLIHGNHIEVANAFALNLPGGQRPGRFSYNDTAHILQIMLGFGNYHRNNSALLNFLQPYVIIKKVADIRTNICHFPLKDNLTIPDATLDGYFKDIKDFVNCLQELGHFPQHQTDQIKAKLDELRHDPVLLSAETVKAIEAVCQQQAGDIKEAMERTSQQQTTEMAGTIMEASQQQSDDLQAYLADTVENMLTGHSELAEKVERLNVAIQEGSEAVQKTIEDGVKEIKLHQSQQSKDVPVFNVVKVKQQLIQEYKNTRSTLPLLPGMPEECADMEDLFVDLEFIEGKDNHQSEIRSRKLKSYSELVGLKKQISKTKGRSKMSKGATKEEHVKRILIQGDPGVGKSTTLSKLAYDWGCEKPDTTVSQFKLVFALNIKQINKEASFVDIIQDQLLPEVSGQWLKQYIQSNASSILLLFDGYDEVSADFHDCKNIKNILRSKWLAESCVIVTTRRNKTSDFCDRYGVYTHVEVNGIDFSNRRKYVKKFFNIDKYKSQVSDHVSSDSDDSSTSSPTYLNCCEEISSDSDDSTSEYFSCCEEIKDSSKEFLSALNTSKTLENLSHNPNLLSMMCLLWKDDQQLPLDMASLYTNFIMHLAKRYYFKTVQFFPDLEMLLKWTNDVLLNIGKVALDGLFSDKLIFTANEFSYQHLEEACLLGVVTKERLRSKTNVAHHVTFLHKTFQEMSAAFYLSRLCQTDAHQFNVYVKQICVSNVLGMEYLLRFTCGYSVQATEIIVKEVADMVRIKADQHGYDFLDVREKNTNAYTRLPIVLLYEADVSLSIFDRLSDHLIPINSFMYLDLNLKDLDLDPEVQTIFDIFTSDESFEQNWPLDVTRAEICRCYDSDVYEIHRQMKNFKQALKMIVHMPNLFSLDITHIYGITEDEKEFPQLSVYDDRFDLELDSNHLISILSKLPVLKELKLEKVQIVGPEAKASTVSSLKVFKCTRVVADSNQWLSLLSCMPCLNKLILDSCACRTSYVGRLTQAKPCTLLEEFVCCNGTNIPAEIVVHIISSQTSLIRLKLEGTEFCSPDIPAELLMITLAYQTSLKKLDLEDFKFGECNLLDTSVCIPAKELKFSCEVDSNQLLKFLSYFPNLENVTLSCCPVGLSKEQHTKVPCKPLPSFSIPVKEMKVSSKVDGNQLLKVLSCMPNLKKISFESCSMAFADQPSYNGIPSKSVSEIVCHWSHDNFPVDFLVLMASSQVSLTRLDLQVIFLDDWGPIVWFLVTGTLLDSQYQRWTHALKPDAMNTYSTVTELFLSCGEALYLLSRGTRYLCHLKCLDLSNAVKLKASHLKALFGGFIRAGTWCQIKTSDETSNSSKERGLALEQLNLSILLNEYDLYSANVMHKLSKAYQFMTQLKCLYLSSIQYGDCGILFDGFIEAGQRQQKLRSKLRDAPDSSSYVLGLSLEKLDFKHNRCISVRKLAEAYQYMPNLRCLNLSYIFTDISEWPLLFDAFIKAGEDITKTRNEKKGQCDSGDNVTSEPFGLPLVELNLVRYLVGQSVGKLAKALMYMPHLKDLNLPGVRLNPSQCKVLFDGLSEAGMKFSSSNSNVNSRRKPLHTSKGGLRMERLRLSTNTICDGYDDACVSLFQALQYMPHLKMLDLQECGIPSCYVEHLDQILKSINEEFEKRSWMFWVVPSYRYHRE